MRKWQVAVIALSPVLGFPLSSFAVVNDVWQGTAPKDDPPDPSQDWTNTANWSLGKVPADAPGAQANIFNGGTALISTEVVGGSLTQLSGGELYIAAGGQLDVITGSTNLRIGTAAAATVTVKNGGTISATGANMSIGNNSTVNQAGTLILSQLQFNSGTYNLTDGAINASGGPGVQIAGGLFNQTGGTITATSSMAVTGGIYQISGGTLSVPTTTSSGNVLVANTAGQLATFRVIGSGAMINISGIRSDGGGATTEFVLDNSAAHITTVNESSGSARRNGTLKVSLNGGVLLAGQTNFTLIHPTAFDGSDYSHQPNATNGDLWVTSKTSGNEVADINTALKASLTSADAQTDNEVTFASANKGYIELAHATGSALNVYLDLMNASAQDQSLLIAGLNSAGILCSAATGPYDVVLLGLNPSSSGGSIFAWDFSGIDPAMGLQGVALPEPSSLALLGLSGLWLTRRRRVRCAEVGV